MAATQKAAGQPLDELMMAMDVVDTLRHDEALVQRELSGTDRDAQLIARLRDIYASQGIDVPDHILLQGVASLKEDRFVYAPPKAGLQRFLALLYIRRMSYARVAAIALAALVISLSAWHFLVTAPRERAAEALQAELSQTLPQDIARLTAAINAAALDDAVKVQAAGLAADGERALARGDAADARRVRDQLAALDSELATTFTVRIVSRPDVPTGVTRIPDVNQSAENFYLVVEAIGADGKPLPRRIVSEEDGREKTVTIWAQRVPVSVFNAVRDDKAQDGIVQDAELGVKLRGKLGIEWSKPVEQGAITEW